MASPTTVLPSLKCAHYSCVRGHARSFQKKEDTGISSSVLQGRNSKATHTLTHPYLAGSSTRGKRKKKKRGKRKKKYENFKTKEDAARGLTILEVMKQFLFLGQGGGVVYRLVGVKKR